MDWRLRGGGCKLLLHPQKSFLWRTKDFVRTASLQTVNCNLWIQSILTKPCIHLTLSWLCLKQLGEGADCSTSICVLLWSLVSSRPGWPNAELCCSLLVQKAESEIFFCSALWGQNLVNSGNSSSSFSFLYSGTLPAAGVSLVHSRLIVFIFFLLWCQANSAACTGQSSSRLGGREQAPDV